MKKAFEQLIEALPDWAKGRIITILADQELVAFKVPREEVKIKKTRCIQCGECCFDVPDGHTPFGSNEEGKCNALKKEGDRWVCTAGYHKPFGCLGPVTQDGCSVEYY